MVGGQTTEALFCLRGLPGSLALASLLFVFSLPLSSAQDVNISISDRGQGSDYLSGVPIELPAAFLSANTFKEGVQCIKDRPHIVRSACFDGSNKLIGDTTPPTNSVPFPAYLNDSRFVYFLQGVRHYTNYTCTIKVDRPVTFYLLVDNRVNEFTDETFLSDPAFGPPDTQWVLDDKWERVNTGISPAGQGDFVGIDEGANGTLNNYYSVYCKKLDKAGSITLRTQYEGNIYCLLVSAGVPPMFMAGGKQAGTIAQ